MNFGGLLRRATFGRKGLEPRPAATGLDPVLSAELQRLDLYKRGLGAETIRYVASGENRTALDAIAACYKATPTYMAPYHKDQEGKARAERATNLGLVTGTIAPGTEIARMMEVRHAAGTFFPRLRGATSAAETLTIQALFAAIENGLSLSQVNYTIPWETIISLRGLLDLVVACGGTATDLFRFILARDATRFITGASWHASEAFGALVRTHPAAFGEALLIVDTKCRPPAIALAEHHGCQDLPETVAALTALLARPYGKIDRALAISALARLDGAVLLGLLERELAGADIDTRFGLVEAAGRNGAPALLALLGDRSAVEKAAKVKAAIQAVLEASSTPSQDLAAGYAAIDGSFVALPPARPIAEEDALPPTDEERAGFDASVAAIVAHRAEMLAKQSADNRRYYQPLTSEQIEATYRLMTQGIPLPAGMHNPLAMEMRAREHGRAWYAAILARQPFSVALRSLLGGHSGAVGKLIAATYIEPAGRLPVEMLRGWIETGRIGLRELVAFDDAIAAARAEAQGHARPAGDPLAHLRTLLAQTRYGEDRRNYQSPLKGFPGAAVWPWLADNLQIFDEALGLQPTAQPIPLDRALATLELLPAVPQRYLAKLIEIAVTEKRPVRRRAMALLRPAKDLDMRIEALLDDSRQQVRINAATWLADIRAAGGEAALRKRLKKEKSDPVRTALIEALQRLGADLSDLIGAASLVAEAEKAAQKGAPELPDWLVGSGIPPVRFRDGSTLPEPVLRHWLALAIRLKEPGATGQFGIYLDQLDPADAQRLSAWVLESWIGFDTQTATLEDANAYALANYAQDYRWRYKGQTAELRDQLVAELRQQKLGEMLNSGSDTKGLLALACRADPVWAANRVRWFLKKHGRRSHQAMALLDVLAGIGAAASLQVVIAASARLKQKSTQARAAEIADRYAEDRGWSFDELADRTVPTAGFDDDGVLELPCGEDGKPYAARLDAALTIHLFNPDGKPVKALPGGSDETTRESAKALSAAKKELKQVIELQAGRLFEAMCVERSWPTSDWHTAFHEHPVMRRLVERLVWQGLDSGGTPAGLFRPTQEGDFTDAADEPIEIDGFARVRLAHGALVDAETCQAWVAHLKDYEVRPFLAQFDTLRAPLSAEQAEGETIADRLGWTAESLTYRGIIEKRGYERVMADGGGCNEYAKPFPSHGIVASIHHSGSYAVDENNRVALKHLGFRKAGQYGAIRLKDVPPVMLAECWADYHALAAKGAFDAEWEKVAPW